MELIWRDEQGKPYKAVGKIDYVSCWHFKAAQFMQGTNIRVAFVSTNSITQGEQVVSTWKPLMERFHVQIDFAWHTFRWNSESTKEAHVHCVIIGFSTAGQRTKYLYSERHRKEAMNISPYLLDAPTVFVENRGKPLSDVPEMTTGNRPADGRHLIIEAEDYAEFIKKEPKAKDYIKEFMGSEEFINCKPRYCLWLVGATPAVLKSMPLVMKRVEACREARLGGALDRQKLADTPTLFRETKNPAHFIIVPQVSSERRRYVPMGFQTVKVIASNLLCIILDGTLYHLGVLMFNVHMGWMRAVAGRLKSDYRYSKNVVYNNFPWPNPDEKQKAAIKQTAQAQISWTNHLIILAGSKTAEEREFYIRLCIKERYSKRQLERQIDSGYYERYMLSQGKLLPEPVKQLDENPFMDSYVVEFLDLPHGYRENDFCRWKSRFCLP